jgi:hypothetical protein
MRKTYNILLNFHACVEFSVFDHKLGVLVKKRHADTHSTPSSPGDRLSRAHWCAPSVYLNTPNNISNSYDRILGPEWIGYVGVCSIIIDPTIIV